MQVRAFCERTAELVVSGLPRVCVESAAWLDAVPVGMARLYELVGARGGRVRRQPVQASGELTLSFDW